jgi:hypothetical protein
MLNLKNLNNLFSDVLKWNIDSIKVVDNIVYFVQFDQPGYNITKEEKISIHELIHIVKLWIISNDICVTSGNGLLKNNGFFCSIDGFVPIEEHIFEADTEYESILNAALFVFEQKYITSKRKLSS